MDYSMIVPKAEKKPETQSAQPAGGFNQAPPPMTMSGHIAQLEQLSQIRRLQNVDLIQSRSMRLNFRDNYEDYYMHGPPHGYPENGHGPQGWPQPPPRPPPTRYMRQGPPPPGPPQPQLASGSFIEGNPHDCTIM
ncbi:hypothetical protein F0562_018039 [Nyssa sinensis]|uniref:Uncharacterized protein n=1 Tax=Nyssa sinensis TaxID=561372 RepID=A0A5J4Z8X4_9ASTE|nr:hypothetical protein F0562_018039 [Nyssa sinensis]